MPSHSLKLEEASPLSQPLAFAHYRRQMEDHLRALASRHGPHDLDEQAVPSYTHRNRLMAWLFWQRLHVTMNYLNRRPLGRVLDFGCGTGVLPPVLLARSQEVLAFDIHQEASRFTIQKLGLDAVRLLDLQQGLEGIETGSVDTIVALDVLEHVDDLGGLCQTFDRVLRPGGHIVLSGPTETPLYRLGRRLAGFKTHFHVRTIYDIEQEMAQTFEMRLVARLYPPVTLFRVSTATKHPA